MKQAALALELTAFAVLIAVPLPVPDFLLLLVLASISVWMRGCSWLDVGLRAENHIGRDIGIGLALGVGIGLALWQLFGLSLDLNVNPVIRGNLQLLITALVIGWVGGALVSEMVFRGYLFHRLRALFGEPHGTVIALGISAFAFGWYASDGSPPQLIGAMFAGFGYGWMMLARGNLVLPIAMHGAFESTLLVLTYLKLT